MLKRVSFVILTLMIANLIIPTASRAQDDDGLSAEELVLLERYLGAPAIVQDYEQYAFNMTRSQNIQFIISYADQSLNLENIEDLDLRGQVDNIAETAHADVALDTFYDEFDGDKGYSLTGEIIIADEIIYAQAEYTDTTGDIAPLPENWQIIHSQADIPPEFRLMGLDYFFDSNLGFIPFRELILETASAITYEENTLPDGTAVEIISILIEDENFATFAHWLVSEEGAGDELFNLILFADNNSGYVDIWVAFDADGHVIHVENFISITLEEVDFADLGGEDLPEGTTVSITADLLLAVDFNDVNIEIDPIEAPFIED